MKTNANLLSTTVVLLTVALSIDANSAALVDPGIQVEIGKYSVNENAGGSDCSGYSWMG
jgi:hypothetical protein